MTERGGEQYIGLGQYAYRRFVRRDHTCGWVMHGQYMRQGQARVRYYSTGVNTNTITNTNTNTNMHIR